MKLGIENGKGKKIGEKIEGMSTLDEIVNADGIRRIEIRIMQRLIVDNLKMNIKRHFFIK